MKHVRQVDAHARHVDVLVAKQILPDLQSRLVVRAIFFAACWSGFSNSFGALTLHSQPKFKSTYVYVYIQFRNSGAK
jgi:hypothetical protein